MNKKRNFLIHGGILAVAGILVRIIGMLYRIPLVNIIGSEANGVYGRAFNVYNIMLVLSSYGLPMAVSKLVSGKFITRQYKSAAKIFRCSLVIAIITGGTAALILFFGADFIERTFYPGVSGIAIPLKVLAPTIFLVAIMGVMRGFYQGQGTMIPTAVSQLVEQIVNAVVSIAAGYFLINAYRESAKVDGYGAAGGTLGTAMGALTGLIFLVIIYLIYRPTFSRMMNKDHTSHYQNNMDIYKTIALTMIPIILGQTFYQISALIDDMMFNKIMLTSGVSTNIKMDLGNFDTSYSLLISIPQGVASAMSASMLPSIVASFTQKDIYAVQNKIAKTIKTNMFIAVPSFVGLIVLGQPVIKLLFASYNSAQGAMMLNIGAIAVVFYTLSTVTSSALQGIDKMSVPVKHSLISLIVHIIIVFVMLKFSRLGIYAIVIGNATFPVLIFILNLMSLREYIGYELEYKKTFGIPLICSIIMGIAVYLCYHGVYSIISSNIIALFVSLLVAAMMYFGPLYLFKKKGIY
jgi:stage V sporulation protein B